MKIIIHKIIRLCRCETSYLKTLINKFGNTVLHNVFWPKADKANDKSWIFHTEKVVINKGHIRGRVSKQVTNGSKTAVMDVRGFLCVSLGSSIVQLHDSLGNRRACPCSEAGFSNQNCDRDWGTYYRRAAFCCAFSEGKRVFIKKCFLFTVGSVCLVKQFITKWKAFRWRRRGLKLSCRSGWDNSQKTSMLRVSTHW
jgi:hypothetical protein